MNKDEEDSWGMKGGKDTFRNPSDVSGATAILVTASKSSVQDKGVSGIYSWSLNLMA